VLAQTWVPTNQGTVAWDAVAKIQTTDTIKYQVYITQIPKVPVKYLGETLNTSATITFPTEGKWVVGVETLRYISGVTDPVKSATFAWSDVAADCAAAGPFGFSYIVAPGTARNLRSTP
jgi:hypothetical protein